MYNSTETNLSASISSTSLNLVTEEPLLKETEERFVMFPLKDESIWAMYKKQVECFWRAEEVDLSKDLASWETLSSDEKNFIKVIHFTKNDNFLVIEADSVILKPLNFFEDGKTIFYLGRDYIHEPYFTFNKNVLGLNERFNHSFVCEFMMYNKNK